MLSRAPEPLLAEAKSHGPRKLRRLRYAVSQLHIHNISESRILDFLVMCGCSPELATWIHQEAILETEELPRDIENGLEKIAQETPVIEIIAQGAFTGAGLFVVMVIVFWLRGSGDTNLAMMVAPWLGVAGVLLGGWLIYVLYDLADRVYDFIQRSRA